MSYFLGVDVATQSLKAVVIDNHLSVISRTSVNYDEDLSTYRTNGGFHQSKDDPSVVTVPPAVFVEALELCLTKLLAIGVDLSKIVAVCGSGQQHGIVTPSAGFMQALQSLHTSESLVHQLSPYLQRPSPIWMDSSTSNQCKEMEDAIGGPEVLADITGSCAYERFSCHQIAKFYQLQSKEYEACERIFLISSFGASLFAGNPVQIDHNEASGMNLFDLKKTMDWSSRCLEARRVPHLAEKLGSPSPSWISSSLISPYFVEQFGFSPSCSVVPFSGDNACSCCVLARQKGDVIVSLGSSFTLMGFTNEYKPDAQEGHVFASPVPDAPYMPLLCFQNGSLVKDEVKNRCANGDWDQFDAALDRTQPGNDGHVGLYYLQPEITPRCTAGYRRFKIQPSLEAVAVETAFEDDVEIRAAVESSFLSMRLHAERSGLIAKRLIATGGASTNRRILQVLANVFGSEIWTMSDSSASALSAAYGSAVRAWHALTSSSIGELMSFEDAFKGKAGEIHLPDLELVASPDESAHEVYSAMVASFSEIEQRSMKNGL